MARFFVLAALLAALGGPGDASATPVFVFDRPSAQPNDRVTVRTRATPAAFELARRLRPLQRPLRLYLVPAATATSVRARADARLILVGSLTPDRLGRGVLMFSVPPLDAGTYALAVWCPGCAERGRGRFFVQRSASLQIETTTACPVTLPNGNRPPGQPRSVSWHGNGFLWAGLERDGTYSVPASRVGADGTIGNKLLWVTTPPWEKPTISGERIDAVASRLHVSGVNTGSFSGAANPSHMSPVGFPTAGCWRLRARLGDLSLVYVVKVVIEG